ncbi:urease accessory protein UreD [Chitinophaga sp.]|uniref:urease accessory protein UreD n=1 Tax=Chitinophaga sp. TaxID=1869181 RepID=UPI0031E2AFD2
MYSELQINTAARNSKTYLQHCYFTRPFKVADISGQHASDLHLTLMSASPGILDGDEYDMKVNVAPGTSLHLYTQSYQRIFQMKLGAKQVFSVHLGAGSSLIYLPHPSVPHENAVFSAVNKIQLEKDSRLLWGEIITCGRKLSGEIFRCRHFQSTTEVRSEGKLVFKDVTLLEPALVPAGEMGQWEGYTHQASLYWQDGAVDMEEMAGEVHDLLSAEAGIRGGVSRTAAGALLVRVLGQGGEQLYQLFKKIALLAGEERRL